MVCDLDRKIQINFDLFKEATAGVSLGDIFSAIRNENRIIPGGELSMAGMKRSISVNGEYVNAEQVGNTVVGSTTGGKIFLKDVAEAIYSHKDYGSFARFDEKKHVTLNGVKMG